MIFGTAAIDITSEGAEKWPCSREKGLGFLSDGKFDPF